MSERLNTCVTLCGHSLPNPVMPASGTFGFGCEMAAWYNLNVLGAVVLKGTTAEERFGNPTPRIAECEAGLLNAIGLQNPGVQAVVTQEVPRLREKYNGTVIANVCGFSVEEYVQVARAFDACEGVQILEVNISCPNVHAGGMAFGTSAAAAAAVAAAVKKAVKKPVFMKLSPNVTSIIEIARACEEAGADGLTLINTLLGMQIHPATGQALVSTKTCGFSGPAILPVALRMVYEAAGAVNIPIIGAGGIATADDVLRFISAGAAAVQVGAQNLVDPFACPGIIEQLPVKMAEYGIQDLTSIRGRTRE